MGERRCLEPFRGPLGRVQGAGLCLGVGGREACHGARLWRRGALAEERTSDAQEAAPASPALAAST